MRRRRTVRHGIDLFDDLEHHALWRARGPAPLSTTEPTRPQRKIPRLMGSLFVDADVAIFRESNISEVDNLFHLESAPDVVDDIARDKGSRRGLLREKFGLDLREVAWLRLLHGPGKLLRCFRL